MAPFFIVMPDLVKVIFIELANKACKIAVLEMLGQYGLCEFFVLEEWSIVESHLPFDTGVNILRGRQSYRRHHPTARLVSTKGLLASLTFFSTEGALVLERSHTCIAFGPRKFRSAWVDSFKA